MFFPKKKTVEHYAGFNRRMWAATFDSLLLVLFVAPVFGYLFRQEVMIDLNAVHQQMEGKTEQETRAILLRALVDSGQVTQWASDVALQTLVLALITAVCWKFWSATPGKMLLRIKVVDAATEAPMTNRQIMLRLVGYVVSTLPLLLGFFWIGFDRRKQGWHDKIAGTVVVIKRVAR